MSADVPCAIPECGALALPPGVIGRRIVFYGKAAILACDANCGKAWGINNRPTRPLSDNPDDYESMADGDLGDAPADPGTYEGGQGKPRTRDERLNKWCARECERSVVLAPGEAIVLPDLSRRRYNLRSREDIRRRASVGIIVVADALAVGRTAAAPSGKDNELRRIAEGGEIRLLPSCVYRDDEPGKPPCGHVSYSACQIAAFRAAARASLGMPPT